MAEEDIRRIEEEERDVYKVRSMRCSDKVIEGIKAICEKNGLNQAEALTEMLKSWQFVNAMSNPELDSRRESIQRFMRLTAGMQDMYISLLKELDGLKSDLETTYRDRLDAKDRLVHDLKKKSKEKDESIGDLKTHLKYLEEKERLMENQCEELKKKAEIQDEVINAKEKEIAVLSKRIAPEDEIKKAKETVEGLTSERDALKNDLKAAVEKHKAELEFVRRDFEARLKEALAEQKLELAEKYAKELSAK